MSDTNGKEPKKKGLLIGLIIGAIIIILLLVIIIILLLGRGADSSAGTADEAPKRNVVVNEENIEEILEDMTDTEKVRPGRYQVTMNSTWRFPDGSSPSENAYVENVVNNTNDVYFDLQLADTGEVILESPIIPRGSHMNNITLDKDLDAGTYNCVLIYHLIDEEQNTLSTLNMAVTLEIAN